MRCAAILLPAKDDGKFTLTALARLEYAAVLERAKQDWAGKTLQMSWGRMKVRDVRVYQSGNRLVIGVDAKLMPRKWPYVEGWLHLVGKPEIGEDGRLRLADLDYGADTDSLLVQLAGYLFRDTAKRELERQLTFDLGPSLAAVQAKLNAIPPRPIGDYGEMRLKVESIVVQSPVADAKHWSFPSPPRARRKRSSSRSMGDKGEAVPSCRAGVLRLTPP
jgi:hypothetical protein